MQDSDFNLGRPRPLRSWLARMNARPCSLLQLYIVAIMVTILPIFTHARGRAFQQAQVDFDHAAADSIRVNEEAVRRLQAQLEAMGAPPVETLNLKPDDPLMRAIKGETP